MLYLAHVSRRKGIFDLIKAFVDVARSFPDCTLYVAGSGPEAQARSDWAERLGIAERVKFLGHVERLVGTREYIVTVRFIVCRPTGNPMQRRS